MVNYWKQRDRRMNVARSYERHAIAGPKMVTTRIVRLDAPRAERPVGYINTVANAPSVKYVGKGNKRIKRVSFK